MSRFPMVRICVRSFVITLALCAVASAGEGNKTVKAPLELEQVVVTAEKRAEQAQDVPTSITAFSGMDVEDSRITTIQDLSLEVPNLFISNWGMRGNSFVFVRGIGAVNNDPAIGFYVDGVNYMDSRVFDSNLFDIERIEVLRGPQGTLYGRNSLAGVVNIVTRKPGNAVNAGVEQTIGDYGLFQTNIYARTPLVKNELFLGISGGLEKRDGYSDNDYLDTDVDAHDSLSGRANLRWTPTGELDISLNVDGEDLDDGAFPMAGLKDLRNNPRHVAYDTEGKNERQAMGVSLRVEYEAPWLRVTSISAYRHYDDTAFNDQDFTPYPLATAYEDIDDEQFTQELRFASPDDGRDFKWMAGLYGFHTQQDHHLTMSFAPDVMLPGMGVDRKTDSDIPTSGGAIFGQGTFTLFKKLDLTAGLRYDYEESSIDHVIALESDGMDLGTTALDDSQSSDAWLPKFQAAYHWTPDLMTYAGVARGYRSGGYNTGYLDTADAAFDPEFSWNYELGFKSSWFGKRLILNTALFYIDLEDQQVVQLLPTADTVIRNAGKSRSMGAEVEGKALLHEGLTFEAGFGYTDAEYVDYEDALSGKDYAGNSTPLAPEYTYNLALQYRHPLTDKIGLFFRSELNGIGSFYWNDANTLKQDAYTLVNLSLGVETEVFDILLWGRNVFDTEYEAVGFEFPGSDPVGQSGDPLTVGVTCRLRLL
jgi:iron complex outermembrane receptor protein